MNELSMVVHFMKQKSGFIKHSSHFEFQVYKWIMIGISLVKSVPYCYIAALRINIFQLYGCQIVNLFQAKVLTKYFIYKNNYYLFNIYFSNFLPCCLFKGCCESCHYFLSQLDTTRHAKKVCKYNLQKHLFMSGCLYVSFHT